MLAVEVAPQNVVYFHLELDHVPGACTIEMDRDSPEPIYAWEYLEPLAYARPGPTHITATISGTLVSREQHWRPPARADSYIHGQRAIGAPTYDEPTRALPGGDQ